MSTNYRFQFGRCLGRGGFGEVYQAEMRSGSGVVRTVAVKVLHERFREVDSAIRRLRDEAHLLAALHHRAIVQVHDLVQIDGQIALVTEYLPGADLDHILREDERVPTRVAIEIAGEVAGALHSAWSSPAPGTDSPIQLVHRDLKPANLRVTPGGEVKVLDFGIARSPEVDREARTSTGIVVGTVGYFSPERLTEDQPQPSDDIYALGCVLFEMVTGRRLYADMKRSDLFRLALTPENHQEFIESRLAAREGDAVLPAAVSDLLYALLATLPADRPTAADVEELCLELQSELTGPTLRQWARDRSWAEPAFSQGKFDGAVVETSTRPSVSGAAPPPVASDRSTFETMMVPSTPRPRPPRPREAPPAPPPASPWGPVAIGAGVGLLAVAGGSWAAWQAGLLDPFLPPPPPPATAAIVAPAAAPPPPAADPPPPPPEVAEEAVAPAPEEAVPGRFPPTDRPAPKSFITALSGRSLLVQNGGTRFGVFDLDSPSVERVALAPPGLARIEDACLSGATVAFAGAGVVEVRNRANDTVIDRLRPGGATVSHIVCLDDGSVAAVSSNTRTGGSMSTGEVVWYDAQGRIRGRLMPPAGVVDIHGHGDSVWVLDGEGAVREWRGTGSPVAQMAPTTGKPQALTPSLAGPVWVAGTAATCNVDGLCVGVDGSRGVLASGAGYTAVATNDRVVLFDSTEGKVFREVEASAVALYARTDGNLIIVEPTVAKTINPATGEVVKTRSWSNAGNF